MDFKAVRRTVDDVIGAMWATDPRDGFIVRDPFLSSSCEQVSVSIAAVLDDRGFGRWTFVQASRPGETNGHAWLEWRVDNTVEFAIDATLQQFHEHPAFIDQGQTPAADEFTEINYRGPIEEWNWFDTGSLPFTRLVDAVRHELALRK